MCTHFTSISSCIKPKIKSAECLIAKYFHRAKTVLPPHRLSPWLPPVAPRWVLEPQDVSVSRGLSVRLDCMAQGTPPPVLTWKKKIKNSEEFASLSSSSSRVTQLSNGSLYIARAEPEHEGLYRCHVENSVGPLSKTVSVTVTAAPSFEEQPTSVATRAGEDAELACRARGDPPPTLHWSHPTTSLRHSPRHRESSVPESDGVVLSVLRLDAVLPGDGGTYTCTAANTHGRNSLDVRLIVHEPPSAPRGLRVSAGSSREVHVTWSTSGPAADSYSLQYLQAYRRGGSGRDGETGPDWRAARELTVSPNEASEGVQLLHLVPATEYLARVTAANTLGRSPPSELLRFSTKGEKPGAAPRGVTAEPLGPTEVKVTWREPPKDEMHGLLVGHYLGLAATAARNRLSNSIHYNFTTIDRPAVNLLENPSHLGSRSNAGSSALHAVDEDNTLWSTVLKALRPSTAYTIVVKAFNTEGAGPLSPPVTVSTHEDVPGAPPRDVRCSALSWDTVQVSWGAPPPEQHNGQIRGYKVEHEPWEEWGEGWPQRSPAAGQSLVLKGLGAATNYSVRVRAYTAAGDGPWAAPVACLTDEDVPDRPRSVRGLVSGRGSFIVSWSPPTRPGGRLTAYRVTWRTAGGLSGRQGTATVPGTATWTQIEGVEGSLIEVEVRASTRVGEGPPSIARVTLTSQVPAGIYTHGDDIKGRQGQDITLLCNSVGDPSPRVEWKHQSRLIHDSNSPETDASSDKRKLLLQGNGRLLIQDAQRGDSGNYTCTASNVHGSDQITHVLSVLVPPSSPLVLASSSSGSSVKVQWKVTDSGGTPLSSFTVYYRRDHGPWTQHSVHRRERQMALEDLECGSRYHVYLVAHNRVGSSPASSTALVKTLGAAPLASSLEQFLTLNSTSAVAYPETWLPQGCAITHFLIEYRPHHQAHWLQVSSSGLQERRVALEGLQPATTYHLRATAASSAGTTVHTYTFTTLTTRGEVPPLWVSGSGQQWVSVRVLLPLLSSVAALASSLALVCYCLRKKNNSLPPSDGSKGSQEQETKESYASRDTKKSLDQRDQYYATIRKIPARDGQQNDQIPENAEDIYPYATFQLPDPHQERGHIPMYSLYHQQGEKPDSYGKNERRDNGSGRTLPQGHTGQGQTKAGANARQGPQHRRSRSRSRGRTLTPGVGDSEDYETLGSETETEHGGVSSRTESSNQLDDMSTLRDHGLIYARPPPQDLKSGCDLVYGIKPKTLHRDHRPPKEKSAKEDIALQQRIHHNLLYHAESSSSPEPSPSTERKSFPRRSRPRSRLKEPDESYAIPDFPRHLLEASALREIQKSPLASSSQRASGGPEGVRVPQHIGSSAPVSGGASKNGPANSQCQLKAGVQIGLRLDPVAAAGRAEDSNAFRPASSNEPRLSSNQPGQTNTPRLSSNQPGLANTPSLNGRRKSVKGDRPRGGPLVNAGAGYDDFSIAV